MKKICAIGYCRRSTKDMQKNSLAIQEEIIRNYADEQGLELIKIFSDKASGRQVKGRDSFLELLEWVENKDFKNILVRDVSRWGRFDNVDESAYWEYHCKNHGKEVIYIEEDFRNDNSLYDALVKNIKRVMAAEYSRKLGKLVLVGSKKIASQGFLPGGHPPYGLKRMLVSEKRVHLRILNKGERKSFVNERVILVPGNKEEIEYVNLIYSLYVNDLLGSTRICNYLNEQAIPSPSGGKWCTNAIDDILKSEKYIGNMVYNMTNKVPGRAKRMNPESEWVKCEGAFVPIVDKRVFFKAKKMRASRRKSYTDEELLSILYERYQKYGIISSSLYYGKGLPLAGTYTKRFGSLETALLLSQKELVEQAKEKTVSSLKNFYRVEESNGSYIIDKKIRLGIKISFTFIRKNLACWIFHLKRKNDDFTLGLGMDGKKSNQRLRYFLFPNLIMKSDTINIPLRVPGFHQIYEYKYLNIF